MKKLLLTQLGILLSLLMLAQMDVLPPVLVSPTNGGTNQLPDVVLNWYPVAGVGPVSYEVEYDLDDQFSNPFTGTVNFSSFKTTELKFGKTYYWRVRATDNTGTSDWSNVRHFTVFSQIVLNLPINEAININPAHELRWNARFGTVVITGVTFFDWQVSPDSAFTTIKNQGSKAQGDWVLPAGQQYAVMTSLLSFDTEYFWRVRARHASDTSDWSDVRTFTTIAKVNLTDPANGATGQMLDLSLTWQAISGAFHYLYELCTDPDFSYPCMSIADINSVKPSGLMFGTTYYWRVKAYHTADTSLWSDVRNFQTINTVGLVSPPNGSFTPELFPNLSWQQVTGTHGFELWYDVSNDFDNPEMVIVEPTKFSHKIITMLSMNQIYYWKVRAFNDGDTTLWSPTWNFTVAIQSVNDLLSDKSMSIYPNPAKESLTLELNSDQFNEIEVRISNLLGQLVFSDKVNFEHRGATITISLDQMDTGLYIIQLRTGESVLSRKIIIDK